MSFPSAMTRRRTWTRTSLVLAAAFLVAWPLALVAQRRNPGTNPTAAEADTNLVKILPTRIAQRSDMLKPGKSGPKPLSNSDKQKLANAVLASLAQQSKIMPNADLAMLPVRKGGNLMTISSFSNPIVLSPNTPSLPAGSLVFLSARGVLTDSQWAAAEWVGDTCCQELVTYVSATSGKTYVLDYAVDATSKMDAQINANGPVLEMAPTQGHLLVPFLASGSGTYMIYLSSSSPAQWVFYSVQIQTAS